MKRKYIILESLDVADLEYKVNKQIVNGYIPIGGVCAFWGGNSFNASYYSQAMILKEALT